MVEAALVSFIVAVLAVPAGNLLWVLACKRWPRLRASSERVAILVLVSKPNGFAPTLVPAERGNVRAAKFAIYSDRLREPRAREIFEDLMAAPWVTERDAVAVLQVARLEAFIESCEAAIAAKGVTRSKTAADLMLRAIGRQTALLDRVGMTPRGRSDFADLLATGGLAAEIKRRLAELEGQS